MRASTRALASDYFSCVAASARHATGASDCNSCLSLQSPAAIAGCLRCRPGVATAAGFWCSACWGDGRPEAAARRCQECLAATPGSADAAYEKCVAGTA